MSGDLEVIVDPTLIAFIDRLEAAPSIVEAELIVAMQRSANAVLRDAMALTPYDTGTLRRGWRVGEVTAAATVVANNVPYAEVVEAGRGAGKPAPPEGALLAWMGRHGIPAEAEYVVRRKIGIGGIAGKHMAQQAFQKNEPAIQEEFRQAGQRIAQKVVGG